MKSIIRRLARVRHAVAGNILMGAVAALGGLFQANPALVIGGIAMILLAAAALVATFVVEPALEGQIYVVQQPQLTDVRAHVPRTKELAQAC